MLSLRTSTASGVAAHPWAQSFALVMGLCLMLCAAPSWGLNSLSIESKTVDGGSVNVPIGIYVTNDVALHSLVLPLEIRGDDPGAFIARRRPSSLGVAAQGRVAASGLVDAVVEGQYASPVVNSCSGPVSSTFTTPVDFMSAGAAAYTSPDAILWSGSRVGGTCLEPGSDGETPSLLLTVDVTGVDGAFTIDTCCITPASHLAFIECGTLSETVPEFTPGVITIESVCGCTCYGDPVCDGVYDVSDVIVALNGAFASAPSPVDPTCDVNPIDLNRDGSISVVDVVLIMEAAYTGFDSLEFDDPGCLWLPVETPETCVPDPPNENAVMIESKQVDPGSTDVTLGIHVTNTVPLTAFVLPLEMRLLEGGAFTSADIRMDIQGRVGASGLMAFCYGPRFLAAPVADICSGPTSGSYQTDPFPKTDLPDFVSPDGMLWTGNRVGPPLAAGADPQETPSFLLRFNVGTDHGRFIVDTCCVRPGNHLLFVDANTLHCIVPQFTAGIVTVGIPNACNDRPEDVNCDGAVDVLDVVRAVGVAFRGIPESPPCCFEATEVCNERPENLNCDAVVNVLDVVCCVNVAFRGMSESEPCCAEE